MTGDVMYAGRALVCAPLMPEFDRESGSRRVYNLIEFLLETGWRVNFAAREARDGGRYARHLRQMGVATAVGFGERLAETLRVARFDLALLAFWHVAEELLPVIRRESPDTRVLVDSIDLHFLRNARQTFLPSDSRVTPALGPKFATEMVRELNAYAAADGVLTVSQKEADLIADFTGDPVLAGAVPDCEDLPISGVPFADRRGVLFVGNFRHAPNVDAVKFLCRDVVPRIDPGLLAQHPVTVVGNDPTEDVREACRERPGVRLAGWVPSVLPYLHHARVTVVPLQYGAGTKRKLMQSLLVGTPAVSTTVGVEGLDLRPGEHLLVVDDPAEFAAGVTRLLTDEVLWQRLAPAGQSHVGVRHGRAVARDRLVARVRAALARVPKAAPPPVLASSPAGYRDLVERIRGVARTALPAGASVLVVSRGDEALLDLDGPRGEHFPQTEQGVYAGHHPVDGAAAVAHLEALRGKGADHLLFPQSAFWWLDHYTDFRDHLDRQYARVWADENCAVYRLTRSDAEPTPARRLDPQEIERLRPTVPDLPQPGTNGDRAGKRVLALGIYLANQLNTVDDVVANLAASSSHLVTQKWISLLGHPPSAAVGGVTVRTELRKVPKFELLNDVLAAEDLSGFDYVLLFDDDIVLPQRFLDRFLPLQDRLEFVIAQPARTSNSYIDHPIVEQQRGCLARQTRFVEIGPVVSFHRSVFDLVFPFDLTSPMGWGYENVWSYQLAKRGQKMGIIDAVPVDHSTRKPVANYGWADADRQRKALLKKHPHYTMDECFRVLDAITLPTPEAVA